MRKSEIPRKYDAPRPGYRRWTTQVEIKLFNEFRKTAEKEGKTLIDAIKEAMENWTYVDEE